MAFFFFLGKEYKLVKQENFDAFLKAAGFPADQIATFLEFHATSKLVKNGDTYTYYSTSHEGAKETSFKSGVEFDDKIQGKIPVKTTYTVDGNTVTQVVSSEKGNATFKREYNGDELLVTITSSNFDGIAKRWYKA